MKALNEVKNTKLAIIPGSFDPMTVGHLSLVERASALFDVVVVAIMINPEKTSALFTLEEKRRIAELTCQDISNVKVTVSEGMLWELARDLGACAIVKGVRNEKDLAYEQEMEIFNRKHYPSAQTIFLPSYDDMRLVSSTDVREKILSGDFPSDMISDGAKGYILSLIEKKRP